MHETNRVVAPGVEERSNSAEGSAKWPGHQGNWGRWPNDRGTLNLITPEVVARAVASVQHGLVISCARPVVGQDPVRSEPCVTQEMLAAGAWDLEPERLESLNASDRITYRTHGMVNTHIDALAHVGYDGRGFNGHRFADMATIQEGVKIGAISQAVAIVTKAHLIDVAANRGVRYLQPGDPVLPGDLEPYLAGVMPGEAVLVRAGGTLAGGKGPEEGGNRHGTWPGLHPECIELLAQSDISILGTDTSGDVFPSPYAHICRSPVHTLCLAFYGIHLLHNLDLERLAEVGRNLRASSFLFVVAPLNLPTATGSLVSPVAIL